MFIYFHIIYFLNLISEFQNKIVKILTAMTCPENLSVQPAEYRAYLAPNNTSPSYVAGYNLPTSSASKL